MITLGIDIGGSGVKGALVDTDKGELVGERHRIETPQPATPKAVIKVVNKIVKHFSYQGPIGVGVPGVVLHGTVWSAANIDDSWVGHESQPAIAAKTGCPTIVLNDADLAAIAEMRFGAGAGKSGAVMVFTLGTGIGSAMFVNGQLVPNLEMGHLYLRNHKKDAESYAAGRIRKAEKLSWKEWGLRLNQYFQHIEFLFSPDLIIIGGGVSKKFEKFSPYIDTRAPIVPAKLRNEAGIIGGALSARALENVA
jgi:polyphosphate glucokinase